MKKLGFPLPLSFFCLLTMLPASAKDHFLPGYIIDLHHDTIQGLIDYQEWTNNPLEVGFKPSKYRTPVYYVPNEIFEFGVLDKQYVSAHVQKEISPFIYSQLDSDPALHLEWDNVFLQTLVGGEKPLYYLKDIVNKEHFYIKEDSTFTLLLHKIYVEYSSNHTQKEYHNMRFIGQLSRYFWDDPSLLEKVADTYYSRTSLEELFAHYLKLPNKKPAYQNKDNKVATVFGLVAGASYTMIQYADDYVTAGWGPSTNFTGGLSLDLAMNDKLQNWSMHNELLYSTFQTKSYVGYFLPSDWAVFDFTYLKLNTLIRFQPTWFFLNAGFSNGYALRHYSSEFNDIRKYEIGIVFGAGIKYKHFSLEAREDMGDGMSPYVGVYTQTNRFQLLLGYVF